MASIKIFTDIFFRMNRRMGRLRIKLSNSMNRANAAHLFMVLFVLFNTAGAWMIAPQYGLITAGVCSGIYGYLLGNE